MKGRAFRPPSFPLVSYAYPNLASGFLLSDGSLLSLLERMAAKSNIQEITGTFLREEHRFNNADGDTIIGTIWVNGEVCQELSVKGQADLDELQPQQTYRFYGKPGTYKNKRTGESKPQFTFDSFVLEQPRSKSGVIGYLKAAGEGHNFGSARALKCWELYGSEAVKICREEPARVADELTQAGLRISDEQMAAVAAVLEKDAALEGCTLELMDVLAGRGFPKGTARLATREWGNRAALKIRRNPYALMLFRGCGFKRCDALYLDLKLDPAKIRRQGLCAWYTLARDTEGHTHHPLAFAEAGIKGNIAAAKVDLPKAIRFAKLAGMVVETQTAGVKGPIVAEARPLADMAGGDSDSIPLAGRAVSRWLGEGKKVRNEIDLAESISTAATEPPFWANIADDLGGITEHQREHLRKALQGTIGILGGSPGTGKTFALAALAKHLCETLGPEQILIGAPTGKAAVRVTENLAKYGLELRARTWHSLLMLLDRFKTKHFPAKVLIGDESSMCDTDLSAAIFRARSAGTHVLLVGDVNQLPPVGHGAPLRDLIAAGLPYGELREIMRNSGGIVEACAAIRDAKAWQPDDNLKLVTATSPPRQIDEMLRELREWGQREGIDPIWDCQVVVPVNKKSPLSRKELNKLLQAELNSNGGMPGSAFRVGDKIVNTKNGYFPPAGRGDFSNRSDEEISTNDRGDIYVANGELAEVIEVEEKLLVAKLSNPSRTIKIPRGKVSDGEADSTASEDGGAADSDTGTGCSWDLGYALSVHKSQGSEWKVVIVMLDDYAGARMVCSREWLYTAISRAKEQCVLIGKKETANAMCRNVALGKRKTFLKERILAKQAERVLVDL